MKDNTSEYSMDSAYHSQSGTRQRTTMTSDGFQWTSDQVFSYEDSSPLLGTESYTPFSGSQDMDQLHLSPTAGAMDAGAQSFDWSANHSLGQDIFNYSTNMSQFTAMDNTYDMGMWGPVSAMSYATNQELSGSDVFNTHAQMQQRQSTNSIEHAVRPELMRQNSFAPQYQPVQPTQSPVDVVSHEFVKPTAAPR